LNEIEKMLSGEMPIKDFIQILDNDKNLQEEIRELITKDVIENREHPLWTQYRLSYQALQENNFNLLKHIKQRCEFDNSISDNLNIWGIFQCVYCALFPKTECTTKYQDKFNLYLDVIGDTYDGPEVEPFIESIIDKNIGIEPKSKRLKIAKQQVFEMFHITGKKRPYWIQGAEWPAGKNSPMQFLSQEKICDGKRFIFKDFDTDEIREVIQYY